MVDDPNEHANEEQLPDTPTKPSAPPEPVDIDVHGEDEATRLRALAADVRDQDDLERDVGRQVNDLASPYALRI